VSVVTSYVTVPVRYTIWVTRYLSPDEYSAVFGSEPPEVTQVSYVVVPTTVVQTVYTMAEIYRTRYSTRTAGVFTETLTRRVVVPA
jgi:hypothetical protein